jgi:dephospho-CoA kinase
MPGSGKEEFVNIARQREIEIIRMGDVVREEVKSRNLELSDENLGTIASQEREKHGFGIWAQRTLPRIKGDLILIDGTRGEAEIAVFREAFGQDMILVGIEASPEVRYDRIVKRARKDATLTLEDFQNRELREKGWGIENAISICDVKLLNEGSLEEFQNKIRDFLKDF